MTLQAIKQHKNKYVVEFRLLKLDHTFHPDWCCVFVRVDMYVATCCIQNWSAGFTNGILVFSTLLISSHEKFFHILNFICNKNFATLNNAVWISSQYKVNQN